ncbi:MAG TPA: hypothetical protein VLC55_10040 [Burkholderiales bacterium]|nr:hypothetical protein [Burkholderiales bacterium]
MNRSSIKGQRLGALFIIGLLMFNYPLLFLFNSALELLGIPLLYAYIFGAWATLIGVMALVIEKGR